MNLEKGDITISQVNWKATFLLIYMLKIVFVKCTHHCASVLFYRLLKVCTVLLNR